MKKRTKRIFSLHHWCGLVAGTFILVMSLSGAVLVFHHEIDIAFSKEHLTLQDPARALSFDRAFENIRRVNPGWEIRVPELPETAHEPVKYELRHGNLRKWIFAHPETGEILGIINDADKRFVNTLLTLHYSFFAGTPGKILVLIVGVAFLILLATGTTVYRKSIARVLTFRQTISTKSRRTFFSGIHRILGVWGLFFNIAICVTGIRIAWVVSSAALKMSPAEIQVPAMERSVDELILAAQSELPDFEITYLRFPTAKRGSLTLLGRHRSDPRWYGQFYSSITIDWETGAISSINLLKDKPLPDRFLIILQPLHFGDYAGLPVKILYAVGGLLPGILAVSGFAIWRLRARHQKHAVRRQTSAILS